MCGLERKSPEGEQTFPEVGKELKKPEDKCSFRGKSQDKQPETTVGESRDFPENMEKPGRNAANYS